MIITSLENKKVKDVVKLQSKKYRDLTNTFVVETSHLVEEATKAGIVKEIFVVDDNDNNSEINYVSYDVMKKMSTMDSPSNVLAICEKIDRKDIIGNKVLILDEIQDPGNLGTIIRSSLAFGVSTIVLSPNCVDLYNPKVLRATQGMLFHIPVVIMDTKEAISKLKSKSIPIYGTNVVNGVDARTLSSEEKDSFALIMGNEGNGLSNDILDLCDKNLYIPTSEKVESLNVGVACSILLYELRR